MKGQNIMTKLDFTPLKVFSYTPEERFAMRTEFARLWLAWAEKYKYDERKALYGCKQAERILNDRDAKKPMASEC